MSAKRGSPGKEATGSTRKKGSIPPAQAGRGGGRTAAGAGVQTGLKEVLSRAQGSIRTQLEDAFDKQQATGVPLMEILRRDVDKDMFVEMWRFLRRPKVKKAMVDAGMVEEKELKAAEASGEAFDPALGKALVDGGLITQEQLDEALAEQDKSGQSFWRVLMNRGLVTPKQVADVRRYGAGAQATDLGDAVITNVLLRTGLVEQEQLDKLMQERAKSGENLFQMLIDRGVVGRDELGEAVARELGLEYVDLRKIEIQPAALDLLSGPLARQHRMIPISREEDVVTLAMANPQDVAAREQFRMMVSLQIKPVLAFEKDILTVIETYGELKQSQAGDEILQGGPEPSAFERFRQRLRKASAADSGMVELAQNVGIINLVASIVEGAIHSRATDIHLEPVQNELRCRYRIDGVLYDVMTLPGDLAPGVVSRIKVLANMDMTERRKPQDGHFSLEVIDRTFDLRVATLPTVRGEKMVLRLLNPEDVFKGLRELGFEADQLDVVNHAISSPYGMILVTGPIGSGKTTTLYSCLSQVDVLSKNVVTIEDPVEYELPGINQVQVDLRVDRTFANMLRSVLRQDANTLMVGEIRDVDTAQVAVRAAMTGHLVFSTLHTNDAVGAVQALSHYKVEPFLTASALTMVAAQRLVRRVCPECREPHKPSRAVLKEIGLTAQKAAHMTFYRAAGCSECYHTGYRGRTGIFEVFSVTEKVREAIVANATHDELHALAVSEGMLTLWDLGMKKVLSGETTLEELMRVTRS